MIATANALVNGIMYSALIWIFAERKPEKKRVAQMLIAICATCFMTAAKNQIVCIAGLIIQLVITGLVYVSESKGYRNSIVKLSLCKAVHILISVSISLILYPLFLAGVQQTSMAAAIAFKLFAVFAVTHGIKDRTDALIKNSGLLPVATGFAGITFDLLILIPQRGFVENNYTIPVSILMTVIVCISLWCVDLKLSRKKQKGLENDNRQLSARLHRSKEVLPAIAAALTDEGMQGDKFRALADEIHQLCEETRIENGKEDMDYRMYSSTGVLLLDEQIKIFSVTAARRNINLDVFIPAVVSDNLSKIEVRQLELQRVIGDLLRNASNAIESRRYVTGSILLNIGFFQHDVLEIEVLDTGAPFPIEVLDRFGERGVTTGGTGNGIPDVLYFVEEHHASFILEEIDAEGDGFTKGIHIVCDGQDRHVLDSVRRSMVSGSFWS